MLTQTPSKMDIGFFEKIYDHPSLNQNELQRLIHAHKKVNFSKGELFLTEGKVASSYYLLENGLFRAFVNDPNGNEITTGFFTEGEIVIEVSSLFQRIPTQENLQALTNGAVWKIDHVDFQGLFHSIAGFWEWGRSWMANQLFSQKQRSINMITTSASQRYLALLKEKPQIIQQAPLKYIASYLGITNSSLSRIRKEIHDV